MKESSVRSLRNAFTLIELLVVVAIIGILVGILTPALQSSMERAKRARVQSDTRSIENAIRAFYQEYSKLPLPDSDQGRADAAYSGTGNSGGYGSPVTTSRAILNRLTTNNPRRIIFLEVPGGATDGTFLDAWGTQYAVALDNDYNGVLTNTVASFGFGTNRVFAPGAAYSAGPDRNLGTTADNVYSFQ